MDRKDKKIKKLEEEIRSLKLCNKITEGHLNKEGKRVCDLLDQNKKYKQFFQLFRELFSFVPKMEKKESYEWEYEIFMYDYTKPTNTDYLKEMGENGWELVGVFPSLDLSVNVCYFKRIKKDVK